MARLPQIEQPDIEPREAEDHYDAVIGRVNEIRDADDAVKSIEEVAENNPVLVSYSPGVQTIHLTTMKSGKWDDQEIVDYLLHALPHEFMHELLYELGDCGELEDETGVGHVYSKHLDDILHSLDVRDLREYADHNT